MSGYLHFFPTNCDPIDRILWAVTDAGDGYHHTEYWSDEDETGQSPKGRIQEAAREAAKEVDALRARLSAAEAQGEAMRAGLVDIVDGMPLTYAECQARARRALEGAKGEGK